MGNASHWDESCFKYTSLGTLCVRIYTSPSSFQLHVRNSRSGPIVPVASCIGATAGPVDRVYQGLGTVLTISGRTIQGRAQVDPELANDARNAIEEVLGKVPKEVADAAMEFRMARAAARN
eukprot:366260-Chlamydomonas_euryale.AAC.33